MVSRDEHTSPDGDILPSVTFVLPSLNAASLLPACLESITRQDYPSDRIRIIVADGGSADGTQDTAARLGARVIDNPKRLAEPGVALGMAAADSDLVVVLAADNGLPRTDWLRLMTRPFIDDAGVIGAYTQIVPADRDNAFTRYYCRLHVEPFTWFVYGAASNPRDFEQAYPARKQAEGWTAYQFTPRDHPLIALAQAFVVRSSFRRREGFDEDDILPIIQMIEDGQDLAYVPAAGVYHHHLESLGHFIAKYRWRIRNSLYEDRVGFNSRLRYMTSGRRLRKVLFPLYGITMLLPFLDGVRLSVKERDACMLWHIPASIALSWVIVLEVVRSWFSGKRSANAQGSGCDE